MKVAGNINNESWDTHIEEKAQVDIKNHNLLHNNVSPYQIISLLYVFILTSLIYWIVNHREEN